jgi:hypothetical protein
MKMGMGKSFAKLTAVLAALGLVFAATAMAYSLPKPKGSPGGPPTPPQTSGGGGNSAANQAAGAATSSGATALGTKLAAQTNAELANQGTFTVTVTFPKGGTMLAKVTSGKTILGQGFAGRATKGKGPLSLSFSAKGKTFLLAHAGQAVKLTVKLTFVPNGKGKIVHSTVTLTTFP